MPKFTCPRCSVALDRLNTGIGVLWACEQCKGRAVTVALLRQQVDQKFMNRLWQDVRNAPIANRYGMRQCPSCHKPMAEVAVSGIAETVQIDACKTCQFLWFDDQETAQLPVLPPKGEPKAKLSPEAAEAVALAKVRQIREQADKEERRDNVLDWWSLADWVLHLLTRPMR